MRKVTHAQKRYDWVNRDEQMHRCRGPRRNHLCMPTFMTVAFGIWAWRGVKFWVSPLTCFVALITLSHYRASVWLRVLLSFSVYISCLYYSGFITAAQLRRPTRQRLDAFVVCTPQQTLRVLFTRSTWLSGTVTRCGLRSYSSSSKSTTALSIFFRNTTSLHQPEQLHSTINSDSVHSPHYRVQMFDPATSLTRILLLL